MEITISVKHRYGDIVYLVTDIDQHERMVTGYTVRENNRIIYELTLGTQSSWHSGYEICDEKNVLKSVL